MVKVEDPAAVGVPEIVAVPSWLSVNVAQLGNEPASLRLGEGTPVVVTVKLVPAAPKVNALVLLALVIFGSAPRFTVGSGGASGSTFCDAASKNAVVLHTSCTGLLATAALLVAVKVMVIVPPGVTASLAVFSKKRSVA